MSKLNKYLESIRSEALYPAKKEGLDKLRQLVKDYAPNPGMADSAQARRAGEDKNAAIMALGKKLSESGLKDEVDKIFDQAGIKTTTTNTAPASKPKEPEMFIGIPHPPDKFPIEEGMKMMNELIRRKVTPAQAAVLLRGKGIPSMMQGKLLKYMVRKINEQV